MGWLLVVFDLPVGTKKERKLASGFRNDLLDCGYLMLQFSVYARCAVTLDKKEGLINELYGINPGTGNIQCLFITDAQWGDSIILHAGQKQSRRGITKDTSIGEQLQFW
jgi:CRISPR-associated protein Cas2